VNKQQTMSLKKGLDVLQSHPLCTKHFSQYEASLTMLGRFRDWDCYLMHRMESGGWPYQRGR